MTKRFFGCFAGLLAVSVLLPRPAHGAALGFDDTLATELVRISANDFENGLSINGTPFQIGLGSPATGDFSEAKPISFMGTWLNPLGGEGSRTIYLIEPGTRDAISDILDYTWTTDGPFSTITGTFTSDSEGSLGTVPSTVPPGDVFVEAAGLTVPFDAPFLSGSIASDAGEVPEPGSIVLAAFGIALLLVGWNRKRAASRT